MKRTRVGFRTVIVSAVLILLFAGACGDYDEPTGGTGGNEPTPSATPASPSPSPSPSPEESPTASSVALELWFHRGDSLFPVTRVQQSTPAVGRAALQALLDGPNERESSLDIGTSIPDGTELLDLNIEDGLATVDLSEEFESGGGSASMFMRLGQVVYTITQFPTVDRVDFRLEGEPVEVFSGEGIALDRPQKRKDYADLLPPIVVLKPYIDQEVSRPMEVSGTANVFEATVSLRLRDENGKVIARDFTTATCGTGCRGDYSTLLNFEVTTEQQGTLEVFESSAKDGTPLHLVAIPVRLVP